MGHPLVSEYPVAHHAGPPRVPSASVSRSFGLLPSVLALACGSCLLVSACVTSQGPEPQLASFPSGQRTASSGPLALELAQAHYDLRQISLEVSLENRGTVPLHLDREGILLAYGELEYPVSTIPTPGTTPGAPPVAERTTLAPGASLQLELSFVTEQPLLEAATLHFLSIHRGDDGWLAPLHVAVPPSAAFVDAASQPDDEDL